MQQRGVELFKGGLSLERGDYVHIQSFMFDLLDYI